MNLRPVVSTCKVQFGRLSQLVICHWLQQAFTEFWSRWNQIVVGQNQRSLKGREMLEVTIQTQLEASSSLLHTILPRERAHAVGTLVGSCACPSLAVV